MNFENKTKPNYWLNSIFLKKCNYNKLKTIVKIINNAGVQVRPLWYPCHKQNFLKMYQGYNLINSESFYKKILCIPSSYFLKTNEINYISKIIKDVVKKKL